MLYSIETIATLIGAQRLGDAPSKVAHLLTDSRSLAFPESTLFFALRTKLGDGHKYMDDLYKRGVKNFVVEKVPEEREARFPGANFLRVPSPLRALQRLAERHRDEFNIPVLGITGSNGKTVVKEWLYRLLFPSLPVTRSPRSYNSQVGVPLSVWLLEQRTKVALFEAGISMPGEMPALRSIIRPTIGLMTNIGPAHQENFSSMEQKCLEKLSLFKDSETLIYCADDALIARCVEACGFDGERLGWSQTDPTKPLFISSMEKEGTYTKIAYRYREKEDSYLLPFSDRASIVNSIHCLAVALRLGLNPHDIAERMKQLVPVAMRLEVIQGLRGCTLINDTYNSDLASLDIALDFVNRHGGAGVLILSDILQSGVDSKTLYTSVSEMAMRRNIRLIIGVGAEISSCESLFPMEKIFFATSDELLNSGFFESLSNEIILLKGSRNFGFEKLTAALTLKVHETVLEVNLEALARNLNHFRSFLKQGTKITCMVKASAYGAGAVEVSKTLQDRGVDYLAVAVADEGAELRRAGITAGIIVMNPEPAAFNTLFEYELEPEIYSFRLLDALIQAARKQGIQGHPVHIKLDTGMRRLGFDPQKDIPELLHRLTHQVALAPRSIFSHLVGSDSVEFDDFSKAQFRLFDQASLKIQQAFPYKILRHICNSAAIARFPEFQLDMVRLGLGLYGFDPFGNFRLDNVNTLLTTILQIREVPSGESIGYSRRTVVERNSLVATLPIGYADGLNRHLGNRKGYCLIHGQKAPYLGNICMDVCMVDVTDIPCKEGDPVEIFGENLPVTELSDILGTIPYEIFTSVSNRVRRIYFQ